MTSFLINPYRFGAAAPLLLDLYPGAAAAYSLRQLRTGVTSVVRVRRSSDNTEADFTAAEVTNGTLAAWVGAGNNGFVRTWYDQSGNSRDATMSVTTQQPQIVSAGVLSVVNSKPGLFFDGTNDYLSFSEINLDAATFSAVSLRTSSNQYQSIFAVGNPSQSYGSISLSVNNDSSYGPLIVPVRANSTTHAKGGLLRQNAQRLITGTWDGVSNTALSSFGIWDNGAGVSLSSSSAVGIDSSTESGIGIAYSLGSRVSYWGGAIQEVVIWPTSLSASRAGIDANINGHFAIF
jgi:hypothetical protein